MKHTLLLCSALFGVACTFQPAQKPTEEPAPPLAFAAYADTLSFRLHPSGAEFLLRDLKTQHVYHIPQAWLTPPKSTETEDNEEGLMEYDSVVTAFALGENRVGIQLSSYDIWEGGSLAMAQGLDVFLALDTLAQKVLPDVLHLGITKQRNRGGGDWYAEYAHFLVSRFPGSPFFSLGTFQEKIYVKYNDNTLLSDGPFYEQTPLRWYVFDGKKWDYAPRLDKYLPLRGGELPMLGLRISPVDWAKSNYEYRAKRER